MLRRWCSLSICVCTIIVLTGCASLNAVSFAEMDRNEHYAKSIRQTGEVCAFQLDPSILADPISLDMTVYEDENGKIVLTGAELTASDNNVLELHFCAHGVIDPACSTIMTACAYGDNDFLQSAIIVEPAEAIITKYSLKTSEFEDFGNSFSLLIAFDGNIKDLDAITVTLQDLYLVQFKRV